MPKKFDRCVQAVKKQSPKVNPYAVCKAALKKKGGAVKVIDDPPVRVQIVRKKRADSGKPKPKKPKPPMKVQVVPPPPPPPPSPEEIKAAEEANFEAKLEADRQARYERNVTLNPSDSQQGPKPTFGIQKKVSDINELQIANESLQDRLKSNLKKLEQLKTIRSKEPNVTEESVKKAKEFLISQNKDLLSRQQTVASQIKARRELLGQKTGVLRLLPSGTSLLEEEKDKDEFEPTAKEIKKLVEEQEKEKKKQEEEKKKQEKEELDPEAEEAKEEILKLFMMTKDILPDLKQTEKVKEIRKRFKPVAEFFDAGDFKSGKKIELNVKKLSGIIKQTLEEIENQKEEFEEKKDSKKTKVIFDFVDNVEDQMRKARLEKFQPVTTGSGVKEDGMWDFQIRKIMNKFPAFKGVIANDEIVKLKPQNKMAFIINTADRDEPGEHWQSVLIDASPNVRAVEFFDSFGRRPSNRQIRDLKDLVDRLNPETMLLFKINKVKHQHPTSNTCGLHAINFLTKRLKGQSFIEATGYKPGQSNNKAKKYENEVERKFSEYL